jgi:two-component system response regulator WspF
VAIVNDLRIATEALRRLLAGQPDCEVAWTAPDGAVAVERCRADTPDLILMDLVMPVMDGVEATRRIMKATPCPILVVTATVDGHLERVYNALGAGALDAVNCPTFGTDGRLEGGEPVLRKIRVLRRMKAPATPSKGHESPDAVPATVRRTESPVPDAPPRRVAPCVLVGSSTGGPEALSVLLRGASKAFTAPFVVVQHLDPEFVPGLVQWLAHETGRRIRAAVAGDRPEDGTVLVACTNDHLVFARDGALRYQVEPADEPYRPSVDALFASAAIPALAPGVAVVLTGMGRDGAAGLLKLRQAGWRTLAQDAASSVVYGMPRACLEAGAAQQVVGLSEMGTSVEASWRGIVGAQGRVVP